MSGRLPPVALTLGAIGFAAFGLVLLVAPGALAVVDLAPRTASAQSDVRAVFGGLELGVAAFLACCARAAAWRRIGLVAQGSTLGGVVAGRLVSLAVDGVPKPVTFAFLVVEAAGAVLAAVALRQRREAA